MKKKMMKKTQCIFSSNVNDAAEVEEADDDEEAQEYDDDS